jgi:uncharacterized protein YecT (DUF1311 family)
MAFLLCLALPTAAFAEECNKLEKQQDLNQCYSKQLLHSEQALGEAHKTIVNRLQDRPDAVASLELAEEAWRVYRDAECLFSASGSAGGSAYPMVLDQCKDELTRARLGRLDAYLHCKEGDLACPVPQQR